MGFDKQVIALKISAELFSQFNTNKDSADCCGNE